MNENESKLKAVAPKFKTDLRAKNRHQLPSITTVDVDHGSNKKNGANH